MNIKNSRSRKILDVVYAGMINLILVYFFIVIYEAFFHNGDLVSVRAVVLSAIIVVFGYLIGDKYYYLYDKFKSGKK